MVNNGEGYASCYSIYYSIYKVLEKGIYQTRHAYIPFNIKRVNS